MVAYIPASPPAIPPTSPPITPKAAVPVAAPVANPSITLNAFTISFIAPRFSITDNTRFNTFSNGSAILIKTSFILSMLASNLAARDILAMS